MEKTKSYLFSKEQKQEIYRMNTCKFLDKCTERNRYSCSDCKKYVEKNQDFFFDHHLEGE